MEKEGRAINIKTKNILLLSGKESTIMKDLKLKRTSEIYQLYKIDLIEFKCTFSGIYDWD